MRGLLKQLPRDVDVAVDRAMKLVDLDVLVCGVRLERSTWDRTAAALPSDRGTGYPS